MWRRVGCGAIGKFLKGVGGRDCLTPLFQHPHMSEIASAFQGCRRYHTALSLLMRNDLDGPRAEHCGAREYLESLLL